MAIGVARRNGAGMVESKPPRSGKRSRVQGGRRYVWVGRRLVSGGGLFDWEWWGGGGLAQGLCGGVAEDADGDDDDAEEEAVHAEDGFMFAFDHGEAEEREREDAERDGSGETAGNFEFALELRFADAQDDQGDELEREAAAVEHDVERDEALEAEAEAEGPATGEEND